MYNLLVKDAARKALLTLPSRDIQRITAAIEALRHNPRPHQAIKLQGFPGAHRLRQGDYRVLYTVDDRARCVVVYRIVHRREAYR
ncbi:MAG: type II toxin-antitoxin system RelE/ParE family toxin [Candidatus Omnitrophica bacterium]|nr:type II toxin-antitoxin system RelE/ParE family toxin [Candidatus Omnitrophota bacterium]